MFVLLISQPICSLLCSPVVCFCLSLTQDVSFGVAVWFMAVENFGEVQAAAYVSRDFRRQRIRHKCWAVKSGSSVSPAGHLSCSISLVLGSHGWEKVRSYFFTSSANFPKVFRSYYECLTLVFIYEYVCSVLWLHFWIHIWFITEITTTMTVFAYPFVTLV